MAATTVFNQLILSVARRLKDSRATADSSSDSGKRYTSAILSEYVNRSIRNLLLESFQKYGQKSFIELFPEYLTIGSDISLTNGVGARPVDCFMILDLAQKTTNLKFRRLEQNNVQDIVSGIDSIIIPSATKPVFYEEGSSFKTLGLTTTGTIVIPRYIKTHTDISPSVTTAGSVKVATSVSASTFVSSTRTLAVVTISPVFSSNDIGKIVVIVDDSGNVYFCKIESIVSGSSVVLADSGLPPGTFIAGEIASIYVSADTQNVTSDLALNAYWHGEVIDRAVNEANQDAKTFAQ